MYLQSTSINLDDLSRHFFEGNAAQLRLTLLYTLTHRPSP